MPAPSRLWPDPRVKPPHGAAELDWSHPLATGLQVLVLFNEGGGLAMDLARRIAGVPTSAPFGTVCADGPGADLSGSARYIFPIPVDTPFVGPISLVWRGVVRGTSTFQSFLGKALTNGAFNCPFDFRTSNAATPLVTLIRSNASVTSAPATPLSWPAVTLNALKTYAVAQVPPTNVNGAVVYINGVSQGTFGMSPDVATPTGAGADLWIGRRQDGVVQMDGIVSVCAIWSRALTPVEFLWQHAEPYAMLRPIVRRRYFVPIAGGPFSVSPEVGAAIFSGVTSPPVQGTLLTPTTA
jgi:hypothetical protein